ncbi:MAG TPA: cupin domain-containing protein [Paludibacter sp.]|nr:cupin domain-containing protein [Paludibacter sp.]
MGRIFLIGILMCLSCFAHAQYNKGIKIEPVLKTDTTSIGQKLMYPQTDGPEVSISRITIPPGASTGWHKHLFPVFAYVEKGSLTVEIRDRGTVVFGKGQSFSEVINVFHNGSNRGTEDVVLFAVYLGEKNKPLSEH